MRAVHHPQRRYEIPWAAIGQRTEVSREKKKKREKRARPSQTGRKKASNGVDEEEEEGGERGGGKGGGGGEDGRSFRIYRRSRSIRIAWRHAAAECSLQPALRM